MMVFSPKNKVFAGSILLGLLLVLSLLLLVIMTLFLKLRDGRRELSVYECEQLLKLGYHSASKAIKSAVTEATQKDNYWVVKQGESDNEYYAIVTPYLVADEWNYRHTSLVSSQDWIDENRNEENLLEPILDAFKDDTVYLTIRDKEVAVEGLRMPVSDRHSLRLSWWLEDEGAKISPRLFENGLDKDNLASFEKVPGITDNQELWGKVGSYFDLDQVQLNLWESLIKRWQNGEIGESEILYQIEEASFPIACVDFIHEQVSFTRLPYVEEALVPVVDWTINAGIAGEEKVNLNAYLDIDREEAIDELADYVLTALPNWELRKGGFPEDYTKTIVANILDYADTDDMVSTHLGEYRGVEAVPWVNEWVTRYETKRVWNTTKADYDYNLVVSQHVELWNMSHHEVSGELQVSYEPGYEMLSSTSERLSLTDSALLRDGLRSSHQLEFSQLDNKWLFSRLTIQLAANEHQLVKIGSISYDLETIGPEFYQTENAVVLEKMYEPYQLSSYRTWWNGAMIDRAGWSNLATQSRGLAQNSQLKVYTQGSTKSKIKTRLYQPSFTYTSGIQYRQSVGDPRMSYYINAQQSAAAYPDNYSPYRRNVKLALYAADSPYKLKPSTRVLISDWGDSGHSSDYLPNHSFNQQSSSTATETVAPDSVVFLENKPVANFDAAISTFSNRGYFVSETELSAVFDPVMWSSTLANWSGYLEVPVQNIDEDATPSLVVGGGNTLRIGRSEHPLFDEQGAKAHQLLDIFHAGREWHVVDQVDKLKGDKQKIHSAINLNTASEKMIEVLLYGLLETDEYLSETLTEVHETNEILRPPTQVIEQSQLQLDVKGIAESIVKYRKNTIIRSVTQVLDIAGKNGQMLFSSLSDYHSLGQNIQSNDAAQEEFFARLYNQSTVRSKNLTAYIQVELLNKQGDVIGLKKKKAQLYINSDNSDSVEVLLINEYAF